VRARYAIVVVPLASLALAACGGSSDSNAVATADSAGISSPAGSETSDGDAVTTIVSATNVSETSSPPSPGPFDDPWAAVTLVDGLAYNLCSLVPENSLASPDVEEPRQMGLHELTGSGFQEGAVACEWVSSNGEELFRVMLWTDDAVQFALDDPTATAVTRVRMWKDLRRAAAAEWEFPTMAIPTEGGWLDVDVDEFDTVSLGVEDGAVVVGVQSSTMSESCYGTDEEIAECQSQRLEAFGTPARAVADAVLQAISEGGGVVASWPESLRSTPEPFTIETRSGTVDICPMAADVLGEQFADSYLVASAYSTDDSQSGAGPLVACWLEPTDRDQHPAVDFDFADASTVGFDAAVADARSSADPSLAGPVADESFIDMSGQVWMRVGSVWARGLSFQDGTGTYYDAPLVDAMSALAARL
jgi:hypothetical protein